MKYLLGYDVGSSSVKAALLDIGLGKIVATAFSPSVEMPIDSPIPGFAEQDPDRWWAELIKATTSLRQQVSWKPNEISAIGISYQMHGLVCIDKNHKPLRPAIIWCDSRAVDTGDAAFRGLGEKFCLQHFLNSPGNFTASKLKWVKENEPHIFDKTFKAFLPGDYIAMKLTGEVNTTITGLSEGIFWDYKTNSIAQTLLDYYGIPNTMLAPAVPIFGEQGKLHKEAAELLGISAGTRVSYRAGDQPNNAYALKAIHPGEIAANAGTSGVVYGVSDKAVYDPLSRVNPFVHVNHSNANPRFGVLLCVNGTGSLNSWMRRQVFTGMSYEEINAAAANAPTGSDGLRCYPFGNGSERILPGKETGATITGLDFNHHRREHIARAAQEGIVFALNYGMGIMREMGMTLHTVRAGFANMFLSDVFASTFANVSGCVLELYNTDGASGAARAAGVGSGIYAGFEESFRGMEVLKRVEPLEQHRRQTVDAYENWKLGL